MTRYFYLDDYTDEVMPCGPHLADWAAWLSAPDEDWPHPVPEHNAIFRAWTYDLVADLDVVYLGIGIDGDAEWGRPLGADAAAASATDFYVRHDGPGSGLNVELSGETLDAALTAAHDFGDPDIGETLTIACVRRGPDVLLTYDDGAHGMAGEPTLTAALEL